MPKYNYESAAEHNPEPENRTIQEPNTITHKPICTACNNRMTRLYVRVYDPAAPNHKRQYVGIGWICAKCGNIIRD